MSREIVQIERAIQELNGNYGKLLAEFDKALEAQRAELDKARESIAAAALENVKAGLQDILDDFEKQTVAEASASIRADIDAKLEVLKTTILQSIKTK